MFYIGRICFYIGVLLLISTEVFAQQLAFPTAEGFGRFATGGRGGVVCKVTNLNSAGPGSFKACMEQSGARTIVFTVGGIIDFLANPLGAIPSDLTVACQTAPGDGVLLKGMVLFYTTKNVIMRYCRIRPGESGTAQSNALLTHYDAVFTTPSNMIFDHMSIGTSNDDLAGGYDFNTVGINVTYQWSIFSEGLMLGTEVSHGVLSAGTVNNKVSFLHNLFADYDKRSPIAGGGNIQIVNNVMHAINSGGESVYLYAQYGPALYNVVNNYFSPVTNLGAPNPRVWVNGCGNANWASFCQPTHETASNIYVNGNAHTTLRPDPTVGSDTSLINYHQDVTTMATKVQTSTLVAGHPSIGSQTDAITARSQVIAGVGARLPALDLTDTRAINDVINGTGRHCGVGGVTEAFCQAFGTYASGTAPTDTDGDGMPNAWETANGLNPNSAADGPAIAGNGWSNLENYINNTSPGSDPPFTPPTAKKISRVPGTGHSYWFPGLE